MTHNLTVKDYKSDLKPIWCPGCGDFGVLQALYRALAGIGRPPHEIAFISGIGCSSRIPGYTTAYGFNSVHGRALPIAQGIKIANPDLLVLVAGVCREALARAKDEGLAAKLLVPMLVYPVAEEIYRDFFASVHAGLVVEQSYQCQLYRVLRMFVDVPKGVVPFARSGANPFQPAEVVARLREVAMGLQKERSSTEPPSEE